MPTQLTLQERAVLETLLRSKTSPTDALAKINKSRVNKGIAETTHLLQDLRPATRLRRSGFRICGLPFG